LLNITPLPKQGTKIIANLATL